MGSLVKNGGGTFNLIGDALLAGTVTVNGGTLAVNGSLESAIGTAGDVTVNAGRHCSTAQAGSTATSSWPAARWAARSR